MENDIIFQKEIWYEQKILEVCARILYYHFNIFIDPADIATDMKKCDNVKIVHPGCQSCEALIR